MTEEAAKFVVKKGLESYSEIKNHKFKNEFVVESEFKNDKGIIIQQLHNPATGEWKTKEVKA